MFHAEVSKPTPNGDFWPAQSLEAWQLTPKETFGHWLAQQRLLGIQQFRESSSRTYTSMFDQWLSFLAARNMSLLEAASKDATEFFEKHEALEPVSRRRYLQLLDRVYQHLRLAGCAHENPMTTELRKERELQLALPPGLDETQLVKLIDGLQQIKGWKGARDRACAALLLGAGLRANELVSLKPDDVKPTFTIYVKPTTVHSEHTTLMLPDGPWRDWYLAWIVDRAKLALPGPTVCPATAKGKPYSPSGLFRRVREWLLPVTTDKTIQQGPNLLRNTFARMALTCGRYQPHEVQSFLGHERMRATARHLAAVEQTALPRDESPNLC